jgi:hypothetical protein
MHIGTININEKNMMLDTEAYWGLLSIVSLQLAFDKLFLFRFLSLLPYTTKYILIYINFAILNFGSCKCSITTASYQTSQF